MQKSKQNANPVGATSSRPHFRGMTKNKQNGITLIALIITIIVMLVLVGVTINVALTGGLFEKGEKAAYQTNVSTIKEQLSLKIAEELAENGGKAPEVGYTIAIGDLPLSSSITTEFGNKLTISKDGTLYYIEEKVNEKEKAWLEEIGITASSGQRTTLTQIKNGDVWNDVTLYTTKISNVTIPTTGIKAVQDENGNYVPETDENGEYIEVTVAKSLGFTVNIGDECAIAATGYNTNNTTVGIGKKNSSAYLTAFGPEPSVGGQSVIEGLLYNQLDDGSIGESLIEEDLEQISYSGQVTATMLYSDENRNLAYLIVPIPQEIKNWFCGDVTYTESDIYFE